MQQVVSEQNLVSQQQLHAQAQPEIQLTEPLSQAYQPTIFINRCNGYLGSKLVQTFRNDHIIETNPNIIIGTIDSNDSTSPPEGVEIINFQDRKTYNTVLSNSDIIIFELENDTKQQFEYLIKLSKYLNQEKKKVIICISSLEGWTQNEEDELKITKRSGSNDDYRKQLENLCMDVQNQNDGIKGYVIYKGIVYGLGQKTLFPIFKKSILQSKQGLDILSPGTNVIPMIHITDLCSIIQYIANNKPKDKYFIATDGNNSTQQSIIKAVADNLGEGIANWKLLQQIAHYQISPLLKLNVKSSKSQFPIVWHSNGFINDIGNVISQFNQYRGIRTNKIYIGGMPVAGKTYLASILSKHYNLPLINVKQTVQMIRHAQTELGESINKILQQTRVKLVQQEQKIFNDAKKKKKVKKGQPVEQFDPSKIVPKLSEENLIKVFRQRLSQQDCKNKGYVLDGFPRTAFQAQQLFKQLDESLPNCSFYIQSTQQEIKERVKKLSPQISKDTHWTDDATLRRLGAHKTYIDGNKHILLFLKNKEIDIKKIPYNLSQPKSEIVLFVERNGPMGLTPCDPLPVPEPQNKEQIFQQNEEKKNQNENSNILDIEKLKANQKKILDQKSKPIRQYLIDNVIPQLTQGLIEVCRQAPQNPLDFLINFLQEKQKSDDIS